MRILLYSSTYLPVLGGVQTVVRELAMGLTSRGHGVVILTKSQNKKLLSIRREHGVLVIRVFHWPESFQPTLLNRSINFIMSRLIRQITQMTFRIILLMYKPDLVNVHFPDIQLKYLQKFDDLKFRLVLSFHGHDILKFFEENDGYVSDRLRSLNRLEKTQLQQLESLVKSSFRITVCSDWLGNKITQLFGEKISDKTLTLPNTVDLNRFDKASRKCVNKFNEPFIFSFGRLELHKGFQDLIKGFCKLNNNKYNLLIGGEGGYKNNLEMIIKDLDGKHASRIKLLGRLDPDEVADLCNRAHLVVIPSRREPFGIAVLEALASGSRVLVSRVDGIPEVAGNFADYYNPATTHAELGKKIFEALHSKVINKFEMRRHLEKFQLKRTLDYFEKELVFPKK